VLVHYQRTHPGSDPGWKNASCVQNTGADFGQSFFAKGREQWHGAPEFHLNRIALLASGCQASRFGDKRAEFKWLELTIGIRN